MNTRTELETLLAQKITSGGADTTAEDVRDFITEFIDSALNITDDKDVAGGYQGADVTDGKINVGNGSNVATPVTPSGDISMTNAGVFTVTSIKPLFRSVSSVGNGTTVETTLRSSTISANQISTGLSEIYGVYGGIFVGSVTATRELKLYFGAGNVIFDSSALAVTANSSWTLRFNIISRSSSIVRYIIELKSEGTPSAVYTSVGELTGLDLTGDMALILTGQAAGVGAADNDIVLMINEVNYIKEP